MNRLIPWPFSSGTVNAGVPVKESPIQKALDTLPTILDRHRANRDFLSDQIFQWASNFFADLKDSVDAKQETMVRVRVNELVQEILVNPLDQSPLQYPVLERDWVWEQWVHADCSTLFSKSPLDGGDIMTQPRPHYLAISMRNWAKEVFDAMPKIPAAMSAVTESKMAPPAPGRSTEKRPIVYQRLCRAAIIQKRKIFEVNPIAKLGDALRGSLLTNSLEQVPLLLKSLSKEVIKGGGQLYVKNFWSDPEPLTKGYVGVHGKMRMPIPAEITKTTVDCNQPVWSSPKKYILIELQIHVKEIMDGTEACAKEIAHGLYKEPNEEGKNSPELISSSQLIYLTSMKKLLHAQEDLKGKTPVIHLPQKVTQANKSNRLYAEIGLLLANEKLGAGKWSEELQAVVPLDKHAVAAAWVATAAKINKILNLPIIEMDESYSWTNTATTVDELYENARQMAPHFEKMCRKVAKSYSGCSVNFGPENKHMIKERKSLQDKINKDRNTHRVPKMHGEDDCERGRMKFMTELLAKTGKSLSEITDGDLTYFKSLAALQSLDVGSRRSFLGSSFPGQCGDLNDSDLVRFREFFPALQTLKLKGCKRITDSGMDSLKGLTALQTLNLKWCNQITDSGMASLKGLTALERLNLRHCSQITAEGLSNLVGLTALQRLKFKGCHGITASGLAKLKDLTVLQTLTLKDCNALTASDLAILKSFIPGLSVHS